MHFQQILMNIGSNAVKYNYDGGSVTVTCREVSYTDTTAEYELTCTDTGIGMSEEFQKKAFEPFAQEGQSARTNYAGTGLGLAIARKLIELQGGTFPLRVYRERELNLFFIFLLKSLLRNRKRNPRCIRTVQWKEFRFCWWKTMS